MPRFPSHFFFRCLLASFVLYGGGPIWAQFETRISSTGSEAADLIKDQKKGQGGGATFKLGQAEFRLSAGLTQEYNDNIGLSQKNRQDDFITSPHWGIDVHYPLSQLNTLDLSLGLSYAKYWKNPQLDSSFILVKPNSLLDFNIYVRDIRFNLHDRISIQQDPTTISQLSNVSKFRRLDNVSGIAMDWDLNTILLKGGYDYDRFVSLDDEFQSLNRSTHILQGSAGVRTSSQAIVGVQSTFSLTEYDQTKTQNNGTTSSAGVFLDMIISEYLKGSATVGYQSSTFDKGGSIQDSSEFNSEIYSVSIDNQLNRWLRHSVGIARFTNLGIGSNFTTIERLSYQASVDLFQDVTTTLAFSYEDFSDSKSIQSEQGSRWNLTPILSYQIFQSARLTLRYQHSEKESNINGSNYDMNQFYIDLNYQF